MPIARFDREADGGAARDALERIAASPAYRSSRFSTKVYGDEPILRTGRELREEQKGSLPYRRIHELSRRDDLRYAPTGRVFYEQARLLEDVEDDYDQAVSFSSFFPTYQVMNEAQLRGYLSWRTSLRNGELRPAPVGFAFVYLYELLMGIGIAPGEEGYRALMGFWQRWKSESDVPSVLDQYLRVWVRDYVVYYGLDRSLLHDEALLQGRSGDAACLYRGVPVLLHWQGQVLLGRAALGDDAQGLFDALCTCSSFRLSTSRFYKDNSEDTVAVVCGVFARMVQHCDKRRKVGFVEGLVGRACSQPYQMFSSAVFHAPQDHPDTVYQAGDEESFVCEQGRWRHRVPCSATERSTELGRILRAVDYRLRLVYGHPNQVREPKVPKYIDGYVRKEVEERHAWRQAHTVAPIELDRSKLKGIRRAAVKTREALLVDEEREDTGWQGASDGFACGQDGPAVAPSRPPGGDTYACDASPSPAVPCGSGGTCSPSPLDEAEQAALRAILEGDAAAFKAVVGAGMASLMVDAINEKLFELVGDAVLEGDDPPLLVEDYMDDVRALLGL